MVPLVAALGIYTMATASHEHEDEKIVRRNSSSGRMGDVRKLSSSLLCAVLRVLTPLLLRSPSRTFTSAASRLAPRALPRCKPRSLLRASVPMERPPWRPGSLRVAAAQGSRKALNAGVQRSVAGAAGWPWVFPRRITSQLTPASILPPLVMQQHKQKANVHRSPRRGTTNEMGGPAVERAAALPALLMSVEMSRTVGKHLQPVVA
jgi:hypothetical protein